MSSEVFSLMQTYLAVQAALFIAMIASFVGLPPRVRNRATRSGHVLMFMVLFFFAMLSGPILGRVTGALDRHALGQPPMAGDGTEVLGMLELVMLITFGLTVSNATLRAWPDLFSLERVRRSGSAAAIRAEDDDLESESVEDDKRAVDAAAADLLAHRVAEDHHTEVV